MTTTLPTDRPVWALAKLGVRDRVQLVVLTCEPGFVRPGHGRGR